MADKHRSFPRVEEAKKEVKVRRGAKDARTATARKLAEARLNDRALRLLD